MKNQNIKLTTQLNQLSELTINTSKSILDIVEDKIQAIVGDDGKLKACALSDVVRGSYLLILSGILNMTSEEDIEDIIRIEKSSLDKVLRNMLEMRLQIKKSN